MILEPDLKGKREFNGIVWEIPPFLPDHLPLRMVIIWGLSFIVALVNGMNGARPHDTADAVVLSYRTGRGWALFYDPSLWVPGFKPTSDQMRVQILLKKTRGNWGQESLLCFLKQKSSLRAEAPWSHREKEGPWRRVVLYGSLGAVGEGLLGI